jgi:predicted transcriptional regulator
MEKTKSGVHQVSEENLNKVEAFFVRRAKDTGSNRLEATVIEIAEGSGVALATAHKAIQQLKKNNVIDIIRPKSRRFGITYIYKRDIEGFEIEQSQQGQLEYLLRLVEEQKEEIADLRWQLQNALGEKRVLENKLRNGQ